MTTDSFDLIIIGGGPGGYVAAIRAAQLGFKVACVEKNKTLGGTCLNEGCIPSKALLNSSEKFADLTDNNLEKIGVNFKGLSLSIDKMMNNKNDIVNGLTRGIDQLFKKNKVNRLFGTGIISKPGEVIIENGKDKGKYNCEKIIIATGSEPISIPGVEIDENKIISSKGALELKNIPKKMLVVGAGYIGLEMGTVWSRLGSEVQVIDSLPRILPGMDNEVASKFKRILEKDGIKFQLNSLVKSIRQVKSSLEISLTDSQNKTHTELKSDVVLIAVGRKPYNQSLGIEKLGIKLSKTGRIEVDKKFQTNIEGIFAIGDVIEGPMLAHKAEEDGIAAVEIMAGVAGHVDYNLIPGIVYTNPEVASIGRTEDELKDSGETFNKGIFPFLANSRARATGDTEGFVKLLADERTDKLLGAHIIGANAGTLIHEIATAMSFGASAEDIARTCHAHPTMNEAVKEAALSLGSGAIHI
ncbi:MAG: Dihydrolipoyl dehydrogenase 3 [Alphaproteobacteria bacterium MarineAlpha2_Bin1]|nr:MAG: Dihydrolipoyl dehydrogenase 3 [Alphaproteobacteria bacterium MarineAlpha2_Bin1]